MQALYGTSTAARSITPVRATLSIRVKPTCQFSQRIDDAFMYTITNIMLHNAISHMFFAGNAQPGGDDRRARRSHERAQLPPGLEPDAPPRLREPRLRTTDPHVLLSLLLRTVTYNGRPKGPPCCARALTGRKVQTGRSKDSCSERSRTFREVPNAFQTELIESARPKGHTTAERSTPELCEARTRLL